MLGGGFPGDQTNPGFATAAAIQPCDGGIDRRQRTAPLSVDAGSVRAVKTARTPARRIEAVTKALAMLSTVTPRARSALTSA